MHVVLNIFLALLGLSVVTSGGIGLYVVYLNYKRRDIRKERMDKRNQEHEAWVVGLHDDADLFFTGSEVHHP
jgi:hypothetical protein